MEKSGFPRQKLPFYRKNKKWRKSVVDWADNKSLLYNNTIRKSYYNKQINYDLVDGKLHVEDMKMVLDPYNNQAIPIAEDIQNYPVIIGPMNVLIGEEAKRRFDFKVVITNPNAISEKEREKTAAIQQFLMQTLQESSQNEEEFNKKMEELSDYFEYDWQDIREMRATYLLNHYVKELDVKRKFNKCFKDLLTVGEESILCDIEGGDVIFEKLNPKKLYVLRHGRSTALEDADIIIYEDYISPGAVIDAYFSDLKEEDICKLEDRLSQGTSTDDMDNIDERPSFINKNDIADKEGNIINDFLFMAAIDGFSADGYFDSSGNVRRLRIWWKSYRKVKKVYYFDEEGNQQFDYFPETYQINEAAGETEEVYWINEAWEGIKIGKDIYVNMRPKKVQYNRINNPSRCHFGIIGEVLSNSGGKAVSMVDRMKPYHYLYIAVKDRTNKLIASNYGKILRLDLARIPAGWDIKKWIHFLRQDKVAIEDSFKEGNKGQATGKLVGNFNHPGNQTIDMELGNSIQHHIELLQFIRGELDRITGVTRQRQGEISNRETVGGVERSVMQSSHITEEYFSAHESFKKRALECLLETAKIALRENPKKLQAIGDDYSMKLMEIGGDEFSEADYGILVDNDNNNEILDQKLDSIAHAAMQNQILSFSTIMDIYTSQSVSFIKRKIAKDERQKMQQQQENFQAELEQKRESDEILKSMEDARLSVQEANNIRDNETKLAISLGTGENPLEDQERIAKIQTMMEKLDLERDKLNETKRKNREDEAIKRQTLKHRSTTKK